MIWLYFEKLKCLALVKRFALRLEESANDR